MQRAEEHTHCHMHHHTDQQLAELRQYVAQQNKLKVLYRKKKKEKETEARLLDR